jgi:hypothetical protein
MRTFDSVHLKKVYKVNLLLTEGAGYIGSHTATVLIGVGHVKVKTVIHFAGLKDDIFRFEDNYG